MDLGDQLNVAILILRVCIGVTVMAHGLNKVFGGGKLAGTGRWFESMGVKPGWLHARLAAGTEIGAGILLSIGLLTPFAAAGIIGVMLVAGIVDHRKNGFFIFRPGEGWEYVSVIGWVCLAIATMGPGGISVDNAIDFQLDGWWGLVVGGVIGVGSGAALLALFWRPPPPKNG
ncbi:MAG: DoxX family protein [Acidimicrobiia bacterium]